MIDLQFSLVQDLQDCYLIVGGFNLLENRLGLPQKIQEQAIQEGEIKSTLQVEFILKSDELKDFSDSEIFRNKTRVDLEEVLKDIPPETLKQRAYDYFREAIMSYDKWGLSCRYISQRPLNNRTLNLYINIKANAERFRDFLIYIT